MFCQWVTQGFRRAACALFGHETVLQFGDHRISLRCIDCGHETTGWTIDDPARRSRATPPASHPEIGTRYAA